MLNMHATCIIAGEKETEDNPVVEEPEEEEENEEVDEIEDQEEDDDEKDELWRKW